MSIVTVGIDLAKNAFPLHGIDQNGQVVFAKPKVARTNCWRRLPTCRLVCPLCPRRSG